MRIRCFRLGSLRQSEVQHLHFSIRSDLDVRRFQVAVNDRFLAVVCGFQSFGNLLRDFERLVDRNWSALDAFGKRLSWHQFHHEELPPAGFFDTMNGCNVGMIQGGQHAGFTLKSRYAVRISGKGLGKELDGDTSTQLRVGGLIDVAETTAAKVGGYDEVCEFGSDHDLTKI